MRVKESTLTGTPTNKLTVIRGALGTLRQTHLGGSLIKKITPKAVEFRRPTYLRASGHTFEYLGYGPGNYSTSLPQVQNKTLSEKEDYLAQAQEKSGGIVVYTGMNNDGDFFIGNKKINSSTGKEKTFDIPTPTITGEDPNNLGVVFDEVVVKQRLVVEGGNSGTVLSQFDGPTKFNSDVRISAESTTTLDGPVKVTNTTQSDSSITGALVVDGGLGVANNVNIGGSMFFPDDKKLHFGTGDDFAIYHNGTNTKFDNKTGDLIIETIDTGDGNGDDIIIKAGTGKTSIFAHNNGAVALWHNGSEKLSTISAGCSITGELQVSDDITAFYSSDERLKDNVTAIDDPLAKVLSLGGYTFDWNENTTKEGTETGVIAQEVDALGLPGLVTTRDNGYLAVNYEKLVPLLIEAVKELSGKVEALEEKLSDK